MIRRNTARLLPIILFGSVLVRAAASLWLGDSVVELPGTADQVSYHTLALRLLDGHGFTFGEDWWPATQAGEPTAHWSFLYTFFLWLVYSLFGPHPLAARLIQAVLTGLLHPFLAYWIGTRIFSRPVGLVAAACTAFYAYFVYYSATLMTEPFFITAVLAILYWSIKLVDAVEPDRLTASKVTIGVILGVLIGSAVLLRQLILLFVPLLFGWILWAAYRKKGLLGSLQALVLAGLVIVVMILPFTIYNYVRFNRFVLLNTNAGFAFYLGNHPVYGTQFEGIYSGSYNDLLPPDVMGLNEAEMESELMKRGLQFIVDDPGRVALLSISRVPVYFMFWPSPESGLISNLSRVVSFGVFWPFMLAGLLIAFARRSRSLMDSTASPAFLLFFFSLVYSLVHLVSWSLIRYRLPVDAVMLVFAGYALVELSRLPLWIQARQHKAS